jgi:hypothetical protein
MEAFQEIRDLFFIQREIIYLSILGIRICKKWEVEGCWSFEVGTGRASLPRNYFIIFFILII